MTTHHDTPASTDTSTLASRIVLEGSDVRTRISKLVIDVLRNNKGLSKSAKAVREILEGAARGVREAGRTDKDTVLGDVLDGIGQGLGKSAQAAKLAIEEATGRGENFATEDLKRLISDLGTLESMFVETSTDFVKDTASNAWQELKDAKAHITRVAHDMKSPIQDALDAAKASPAKLSAQAAGSGVKMARQATGSLFEAFAGVLGGLGQAISPDSEDKKK